MADDLATTHPCGWDTEEGCPVCGLTRETMALLRRTPLLDVPLSRSLNLRPLNDQPVERVCDLCLAPAFDQLSGGMVLCEEHIGAELARRASFEG